MPKIITELDPKQARALNWEFPQNFKALEKNPELDRVYEIIKKGGVASIAYDKEGSPYQNPFDDKSPTRKYLRNRHNVDVEFAVYKPSEDAKPRLCVRLYDPSHRDENIRDRLDQFYEKIQNNRLSQDERDQALRQVTDFVQLKHVQDYFKKVKR